MSPIKTQNYITSMWEDLELRLIYSNGCTHDNDFMRLTDTWLSEDVLSSELFPRNYVYIHVVVRHDRQLSVLRHDTPIVIEDTHHPSLTLSCPVHN